MLLNQAKCHFETMTSADNGQLAKENECMLLYNGIKL